jgi:hypothetical protein
VVGQGFARLGAPDPRLNSTGGIDFRLQRQLRGYAQADPPPRRVKPIPISVIHHLLTSGTDPFQKGTFFNYLATFFVSSHIFMYHCSFFLCVQKSHKYGARHLKIAANHMNNTRIFSPFIVVVYLLS